MTSRHATPLTSDDAGLRAQGAVWRAGGPWLVLLAGLAFTAFLTVQLWREVQAKDQARFETEIRRATGNIQNRLETYASMLRGGVGLFSATDDQVSRQEFRNYVASLELPTKYPGIQGIGFAERVTTDRREAFEQRAIEAGVITDKGPFHVWPDQGQSEFYSIIYLEPLDRRNLAAIGYDMFSEPVRREAMERARDTGAPAASGKVTLVQEIDPRHQQAGFLIYMPFYGWRDTPQTVEERRAAIQGFVYSPFRADDLLRGTLGHGGRPMVDFEVYDGDRVDAAQLLHRSANDMPQRAQHRLAGSASIEVAGRTWTLRFVPTPQFFVSSDYNSVPVTAFIGVIFSFALFGFSLAQVGARRSAELRRRLAQDESQKRQQTEEILLREKNFTDAVVNSLPGMFYVVDADGRYLRWNATLERVTGYTHDQVATMRPQDFFRPQHHPLLESRIREVFERGFAKMEAPLLTADGREIPHLFTGVRAMLNGRECLVGLALDITELHRAQENNARLAAIVKNSNDAIISKTLDGIITSFNPAAERLYGYTAQEAIGKPISIIIPPERAGEMESILQRLRRGEHIAHYETVRMRKDGSRVHVSVTISPTILADGTLVGASSTARDITERKQAQEALAQSKQRLELAKRAGKIGSYEWDLKSNRIVWSAMEEELYGLPAGSFGGTYEEWVRLIHPQDRAAVERAVRNALQGCAELLIEFRINRPDGSVRWLLGQGSVICDEQGRAARLIGVNIDITDRKQAEIDLAHHRNHLEELVAERTAELEQTHQRLRMSERMAALGTLSAGLGHDMGNLLLPMRLRLDAMEARGASPELREDIQAIRKCAEYLQRLVNGLRLFALDPQDAQASNQSTNLHEWWEDVKPFLHNAVPRHVRLEHQFSPDLPLLKIPRHLLTQVLFNLVQNAGDALCNRDSGQVRIWAQPANGGSMVRVGVSDDGPGMPPHVVQRCMEPFFTTKVRGLSTGLGLALVHGIVHKAGGQVGIQSEIGVGTTFTLVLPSAPSMPRIRSHGRPVAVVSLADERLQAYVTSVLQTMAFEVRSLASPNGHNADLWITDARRDLESDVPEFLAANPRRRVLIFGQPPGSLPPAGVVAVDASPRPAVIREALLQIARDLQEQPAVTVEAATERGAHANAAVDAAGR